MDIDWPPPCTRTDVLHSNSPWHNTANVLCHNISAISLPAKTHPSYFNENLIPALKKRLITPFAVILRHVEDNLLIFLQQCPADIHLLAISQTRCPQLLDICEWRTSVLATLKTRLAYWHGSPLTYPMSDWYSSMWNLNICIHLLLFNMLEGMLLLF